MFSLAQAGWLSMNTSLCWESIQSVPAKQKALTFSVIIAGLGSLVICDAPHHTRLMASHLGFGCGVRLDRLPRFNDLFLGLYDLFFGWFQRFGCRGLFVRYFCSHLGFLIIGVLQNEY